MKKLAKPEESGPVVRHRSTLGRRGRLPFIYRYVEAVQGEGSGISSLKPRRTCLRSDRYEIEQLLRINPHLVWPPDVELLANRPVSALIFVGVDVP